MKDFKTFIGLKKKESYVDFLCFWSEDDRMSILFFWVPVTILILIPFLIFSGICYLIAKCIERVLKGDQQ